MTYALNRICVTRDGQEVLHDITLTLATGTLIGVIGPNGAGKSTLLGTLAADLPATQGVLTLNGASLEGLAPNQLARSRAVMSQQAAAIFNLSVTQVLALGLFAFDDLPQAELNGLVQQVAQCTGIVPWLDRAMTSLSLGQQQRVHFARALLQAKATIQYCGQAWLLLDEPTANQDPAHQQSMMHACRELLAKGTVGVVIAMHDLSLAAQWCDEVIVLKQGGLLTHGSAKAVLTPETLKQTFGHELGVHVQEAPRGVIVYTP